MFYRWGSRNASLGVNLQLTHSLDEFWMKVLLGSNSLFEKLSSQRRAAALQICKEYS